MVNYAQGLQNLRAAVNTLAGTGDQKQRLESAIILNMSGINPALDLPPQIREDFIAFMRQMCSQRTHDSEGAVWEMIRQMDRLERQQAVMRIIDFYDVVNRAIGFGAGTPRSA